jgi:hypothetical protein
MITKATVALLAVLAARCGKAASRRGAASMKYRPRWMFAPDAANVYLAPCAGTRYAAGCVEPAAGARDGGR